MIPVSIVSGKGNEKTSSEPRDADCPRHSDSCIRNGVFHCEGIHEVVFPSERPSNHRWTQDDRLHACEYREDNAAAHKNRWRPTGDLSCSLQRSSGGTRLWGLAPSPPPAIACRRYEPTLFGIH